MQLGGVGAVVGADREPDRGSQDDLDGVEQVATGADAVREVAREIDRDRVAGLPSPVTVAGSDSDDHQLVAVDPADARVGRQHLAEVLDRAPQQLGRGPVPQRLARLRRARRARARPTATGPASSRRPISSAKP